MASQSLQIWRAARLPGLAALDAQCAAYSPVVSPNTVLLGENLRGYAVLLIAHFQGFCRDLHTECVQLVVALMPTSFRPLIQRQFDADRKLDKGNPFVENLRADFGRLDLNLRAAFDANPAWASWLTQLGLLNSWRNYAAHHNPTPPTGGPPTLAGLGNCLRSCDAIASELDSILYNHMSGMLGVPPWQPI